MYINDLCLFRYCYMKYKLQGKNVTRHTNNKGTFLNHRFIDNNNYKLKIYDK